MKSFSWLFSLGLVGSSLAAQVSFVPLGYLDAWGPTSEAYAVDARGTRIVGYSTTSLTSNLACWWTSAGIAALPGGQNWFNNVATDLSADGTLIAGYNSFGGTEEAFVWTEAGTTQYLAFPPPPLPATNLRASAALSVSADGEVVVGSVTYTIGDGAQAARYPRSFRWRTGDAVATLLPQLPGDFFSDTATGVNRDGSIVVGTAFTSLSTQAAVYWTEDGGPFVLNKEGDAVTMVIANDVSADGRVIVGAGVDTVSGQGVAFKYTEETGPVALPAPTTGFYAYSGLTALGVSGDGRVVVGYGLNVAGEEEAVFWVEEQPYRVSDVAFAGGVLPAQWEPFRAYGADFYGNTICGHGRATSGKVEAFALVLDATPEPPALAVASGIELDAVVGEGELRIRYQATPGMRYRVVGGTDPGNLQPLSDWVEGLGFEMDYTARPDFDAGPYYMAVESRND